MTWEEISKELFEKMTAERFTVDSDGKWWDRITHEYVTLDNLFRTVEELDNKLESKQHTINEMAKTIRIYDDGYIDLNKKYKKLKDENEQLKQDNNALIHLLENQSMIIEELHSKLLEYQVKEPITLTKKDLELMDKAISYYTHGRCGE